MLKLGVNIDHVATLREARYRGCGHGEPDPVEAAKICVAAGAHGITVHLREDRRHIQDRDVWKIREVVRTRLNLEMANAPEIVGIALKLKPEIVCLVPERRQEVTTEGGLDVVGNERALTETRKKMNDAGIGVSLFIAPDPAQINAAARTGSQFIELHTGQFAESFHAKPAKELREYQGDNEQRRLTFEAIKALSGTERAELGVAIRVSTSVSHLTEAANRAHALGLQVNAGHGLNYANLTVMFQVPHLVELNIGHSIVSRAVTVGLESAVKEMLHLMENYQGQK